MTVFPQCHRPSVTPTTIKILHKQTHVYTSIASFVKAGRIAKHYKAAVCISKNSFTLNFFTLLSLLLNPTPIHFQFPPHKTPNNVSARSRFVRCDVPTVNLEYTIREETQTVNAQLHCKNYKWQLHVPATQQPTAGCLCEQYNSKSHIYSLHS